MDASAVKVGIVGLGRSGWDIHAQALRKLMSTYRIAAIMDSQPSRREEAVQTLGCRACEHLQSILNDDQVELIVVASPSHLHAEQSIEALRRGKHVVCEKPMALSTLDADRMIDAADRAGKLLTIFNNMRYWDEFAKVREVINSGVLGRIVQIKITLHRFGRRWDWQTLSQFGGGALFNAGAHLVDLAMQLLGDVEPEITVDLQRTLTSGDAEDHAKILLRAQDRPTIEVEITSACAYPQDKWHVMGTSGGLRGNPDRLEWKWVDFSKLPDRPADTTPAATDRQWNREDLPWQTASWTANMSDRNRDHLAFYEDLHKSIRSGMPLVITPQSVRRTLSVLEKCRQLGEVGKLGLGSDLADIR
jgi:predicted dehydrogenase